ncbi:dTDP-4-dehydrorhamnose 3,5-epimerase [Lutimonas saemankumensis]|uniref:dTDP-4-dehydrorhamnose 3,5-epimerase n=1 Tax=Lutimonas saemankumensis TaxID=483016 RepID=UPI001CD5A633|nr:dTDP-4-dehydrorhamnose 3,5-epimerase [Lutimonas saemankumensis]MCA0931585.1 dTDP-4-dehydrorhamnose 3,5-epimerase [Lutimonas saemankumensis]
MNIESVGLKDCYLIKPNIFNDERGYFFESFNNKTLNEELGMDLNFVQDNRSYSKYGVLRGLHFQKGNHSQAKLVNVLSGRVQDVVVDIRPDSETFGKHISVELNSDNKTQLFIPRGCAHGFLVLSEFAEFYYKVDNYYNPMSESGIIYNDPDLDINWQIEKKDLVINNKDLDLPLFKNVIK